MGTGVPEGVERGAIEAGSRDVRLRAMMPADIPAVTALEHATFSTPWRSETFARLLDASVGVEVWIAEDSEDTDDVLGYAVLWKAADQGELANLAVEPDARGRGIGGRLLDRVLERCREGGITGLYLEVRSSNEGAIALYEGRGFQTVGVRRNYYTRPREDAIVMMRSFPDDQPAGSPQ